MSGFDKNSWSNYLNGVTSQYNFKYRSEEPLPMGSPITNPVQVSPQSIPNTVTSKQVEPITIVSKTINSTQKTKKNNQNGGKRNYLKKRRNITRRRK
jgi:hypothetical protein